MIAAFRSTFFIVIGMRARLTKVPRRPSPRIGRPAGGFGPRFKDVARSARKCSRSWFGVIRTIAKQAQRSRASSVRSFAQVDQFVRQEKIVKSQQEAGGHAVLAMTN